MDETLIIKAAEALAALQAHEPTMEVLALIARTMTSLELRSTREPAAPEQVREALLLQRVNMSLKMVDTSMWLIKSV